MSDLEEFFSKVGTEHTFVLRVCNKLCGAGNWPCEYIVTDDPDIPTLVCTTCPKGRVICDCEMAGGSQPNFCVIGEGEFGCNHQPPSI